MFEPYEFTIILNTMISPPHKSHTLSFYLDPDEEVDYGSDTIVHGDKRTLSYQLGPEFRPLTAPSPFVECK